ncbi:MAG: hypothetical protein NZ901_10000 [Geminocystis sp.]|nr:hypothetical protein [Geminocystis sp.]HIK36760.1 hypothetical protein [Geminocystis sp. M7585_C2015_104]MCS7148506.1 hypothetical protein [Geminocystis sp.]MCX8079462.1 hypothetical protein [Geminocystis sp.]MDW8114921.1 hypothetical protein [Geminocystis sp.]
MIVISFQSVNLPQGLAGRQGLLVSRLATFLPPLPVSLLPSPLPPYPLTDFFLDFSHQL